MQINSISSSSHQPAIPIEPSNKAKEAFQKLGSALESGNLSDAKNALAQLQKNAPAQTGNENNPISAKMEALSKAVNSGDVKAAQQAYADVKKTVSQNPPAGGQGSTPPATAQASSNASSGLSASKIYDKRDINRDGKVSMAEDQTYSRKHPKIGKKASTETSEASTAPKAEKGKSPLDIIA